MIKKTPAGNRNLKILLSVTLAVAAILTLILLFVPEKEGRSAELPGTLLRMDGESKACTVGLQGSFNTYAFRKDEPVFRGTLQLDGQTVRELNLAFDSGYYVADRADPAALMTYEIELAVQISQDGADWLLLAPAPDEETAQRLLSQFLADADYARQQGWETYR